MDGISKVTMNNEKLQYLIMELNLFSLLSEP